MLDRINAAGALTYVLVEEGGAGRWLVKRLKRGAELVAAALFALLFAAFMIQIISRYVLNMPVSWSLELCSIAYVWVVFWTCGILVSERKQIVFDVLYTRFPPRARRWLAIANTAALALVFLAALPGTLDYIHFLAPAALHGAARAHEPRLCVLRHLHDRGHRRRGAPLRRLAGPSWQQSPLSGRA